jgi:hypothetical protein
MIVAFWLQKRDLELETCMLIGARGRQCAYKGTSGDKWRVSLPGSVIAGA